jgi:hypothetical protein
LKHRHESNVAKNSPVREKSAVLLDVSDSPAQQHSGLCANVFVTDQDLSALRLDESVEAAEQRGFAGSAFAHERNRASGWNIDADIIERDHRPEVM